MSEIKQEEENKTTPVTEEVSKEETTELQEEQPNTTEEKAETATETDNVSVDVETLQKKYDELNDTHLRLRAEFDNYRKRTMREKSDLIKMGGETALKNLLPVVDDFERALQNVRSAEDVKAIKEGIDLIFGKFVAYLAQQGVKPIEAIGKPFNTEEFEAIATIPAPDPETKGKILDCVQTGYTLFDKVIRHAKVVVGE